MSHNTKSTILIGIAVALVAVPATLAKQTEKVKGEVIRVEQQTRNQGEETLITVRTRTGEERQLRVGKVGDCPECVQVGDQIRARVQRQESGGERSGAGGSGGQQIREMAVQRGGGRQEYRYESGRMTETTQRLRDGSGDGRQLHGAAGGGSPGAGGSHGSGGSQGGGGGNGNRGGSGRG